MTHSSPSGARLAIFDLFDTIIIKRRSDYESNPNPDSLIRPEDGDWFIRPGFDPMLTYLRNSDIKFAISSDAYEERIAWILHNAGYPIEKLDNVLGSLFVGIYGKDNRFYVDGVRFYKNLGTVISNAGVDKKNSVLIGDDDNELDSASASFYGIRFQRIPNGREDPRFNLMRLIEMDYLF